MRPIVVLVAISCIALFVLVPPAQAQEDSTTTITIRTAKVVTGVVIVWGQSTTATTGKPASFELQCNEGMAACTVVQPGTYTMAKLGKNRGMYDCVNVELYAKDADPETSARIGAYCLIQK